jgi:phage gp36-like protein
MQLMRFEGEKFDSNVENRFVLPLDQINGIMSLFECSVDLYFIISYF